MSRILVTGASGFLGYTLCRELAPSEDVIACYHTNPVNVSGCRSTQLDITDSSHVHALFGELRPDIVIHSAALAQPDACELNPEAARSVIVEGTRNVASQSTHHGCRLLHISTDLVFDGRKGNYTEEDPVRGISVYSTCKIAAEEVVASLDPAAVILRVSVLYGPGSPFSRGFLGNMLAAWRSGRPMTFYKDQFRTPTFGPRVARVIESIVSRPDLNGVFHVGGADRLSRYEFACLVARYAGAPPELVRPGSMNTAGAVAARGADCSLVSEKLRSAVGMDPLGCEVGLEELARHGLLAL